LISVIRRWAGSGGWKARWRCDANALPAVHTALIRRAVPHADGSPDGRVAEGTAQGYPGRMCHGPSTVEGRKPDIRARRTADHRETARPKPTNIARGAPGIRHLRGDYACVFLTHHTQGCGVVVTPAFRAPSLLRGQAGNALSDDGLPGAAKNTGDESCLLLIPHPKGEVASVSEPGGGLVRCGEQTPPRTHFAFAQCILPSPCRACTRARASAARVGGIRKNRCLKI
jgi:hypothetical protein